MNFLKEIELKSKAFVTMLNRLGMDRLNKTCDVDENKNVTKVNGLKKREMGDGDALCLVSMNMQILARFSFF